MKKMIDLEVFNSTCTADHMLRNHFLENGLSRITYSHPTSSDEDSCLASKRQGKVESVLRIINKLAKGKLSLGAKVVQPRRSENVFRRLFSVREGEQLLKASKCCLSTTAGPIAGRVFISTDKLAFCSDNPIARFTSSGESLKFHYKVVIPLSKIKRANQSKNVKKPSQKYLQVITTDDFEFWFMGFVNCKRTFKYLQQAVSQK